MCNIYIFIYSGNGIADGSKISIVTVAIATRNEKRANELENKRDVTRANGSIGNSVCAPSTSL